MSEFLAMGGYTVYVWSSYAIAVVAMVALTWSAGRRHRQQLARIARRIKREGSE